MYQSILLYRITDNSLISLSKCAKLNTLEIRGCPMITSTGLSEIAMGCRLLSKLDIKKCFEINDVGMLYLSQFSHSLRQVLVLFSCNCNWNLIVPCMFRNCANTVSVSSQINLSYCSVTDIGLLSLSSISGLQNMTIVHLAGITPNGVTATLMVCGCLTKVKLHEAFKSMMPAHMIKNVEARGCVFQWTDKPFKVFYYSPGCFTQR